MAIKVKDAATAATKFAQRAAAAAPDYAKGVVGSGQTWQAHTLAAKDAWSAGVQAAVGRDGFSKGVNAAGGAKFESAASGKGAQRYPQGVQQAGPAWQAHTSKFLDVIASLNLPPRLPKGDPGNYRRSQMVGDALRKAKVGG